MNQDLNNSTLTITQNKVLNYFNIEDAKTLVKLKEK